LLYTRVSSDEQNTGDFSTAAQSKLLQEDASKNNFKVIGEQEDTETSLPPAATPGGL